MAERESGGFTPEIATETGTTSCPICGRSAPHYHHPRTTHVAQMIGSWFCGAERYSPVVSRWLSTAVGKSALRLADEILQGGEA